MENNCSKIIVDKDENRTIFLDNFLDSDNLQITVSKGARFSLNLFALHSSKSLQISINLLEKAQFCGAFADFSNSTYSCTVHIYLQDDYTRAEWHMSCLSSHADNKKIDVSFSHIGKHTFSLMDNYGVARDNSHLVFKGISHIERGASKSDAKQVSKIIVFDDDVIAESSPSLCIDENDVNASHSAIVGTLNEDHVFYLKSRGLNEQEAKTLITYGYLSPISIFFGEDYRSKINSALKEIF